MARESDIIGTMIAGVLILSLIFGAMILISQNNLQLKLGSSGGLILGISLAGLGLFLIVISSCFANFYNSYNFRGEK